jgi:PadR family transcriptional regulator PadR
LYLGHNNKVAGIERVTRQLLDLLGVLLDAHMQDTELHGYQIKQMAGLSGPSTYRGLDRLEEAGLVDARWEIQTQQDPARPRRRYYMLNPAGAATARTLISERRPEALQHLGRRRGGWSPVPGAGFGALLTAVLGMAGSVR